MYQQVSKISTSTPSFVNHPHILPILHTENCLAQKYVMLIEATIMLQRTQSMAAQELGQCVVANAAAGRLAQLVRASC